MNIDYFFPQTTWQWNITLIFFVTLSIVLLISEFLSRFLKLSREFSRKFIHIAVGLLVVLFSFYLSEPQPLIFLCVLFTVANFFIKKYDLVPSMQSDRETYGTVYYPLAILITIILFWNAYRFIFINVVLILALADAFAAVSGQTVKKPIQYKVWDDWKSVQGSAVFLAITSIIVLVSYLFLAPLPGDHSIYPVYISALSIGWATMLAESISARGSDNFSIVLVAGFFFYIFFYSDPVYQKQFFYALIFAGIIAVISMRIHFLKVDGAISMSIMAIFIYGIGGWQWTTPILLFFVTSSLLSKVGRRKKLNLRLLFEKSSKRDSRQVFANGGIALLIILFYFFEPNALLFHLYLIALAAANADTWATELGVFNISRPRMITTFKQAEKGSSGAISSLGTFAAFAGSFVVVLTGSMYSDIPVNHLLLLTLFGFFATFIDSLLGATLQAQYTSSRQKAITEREKDDDGNVNELVRGYRWLNNDVVNFMSILSAPLAYLVLSILI